MIGAWLAKRRVRAAFAALNERDLDRFIDGFADDATWVYPGDLRPSGEYHGRSDIRAWFERFFEQFPTLRFTLRSVAVDSLLDVMGDNVLAAHWDLSIVSRDGRTGSDSGVTVITLRKGRAVRAQDFIFDTGPGWRAAWGQPA